MSSTPILKVNIAPTLPIKDPETKGCPLVSLILVAFCSSRQKVLPILSYFLQLFSLQNAKHLKTPKVPALSLVFQSLSLPKEMKPLWELQAALVRCPRNEGPEREVHRSPSAVGQGGSKMPGAWACAVRRTWAAQQSLFLHHQQRHATPSYATPSCVHAPCAPRLGSDPLDERSRHLPWSFVCSPRQERRRSYGEEHSGSVVGSGRARQGCFLEKRENQLETVQVRPCFYLSAHFF